MKKIFIIQKLVMAETIQEAIKIEKKYPPTSVFIDDDWKKTHLDFSAAGGSVTKLGLNKK
jgi:hypothetical protein